MTRRSTCRLAVAALSARAIADAAVRDGCEVIALDVFGDADTRRLAVRWVDIGSPASLSIDAGRLLGALQALVREGGVDGWVAGAGFDGRADLLAQAERVLPLLGTAAADVARLRDPRTFFDTLRAHSIDHPAVVFDAPSPAEGWLVKDAGGSGGWQVRPAAQAPATRAAASPPGRYFQRRSNGVPMSATLLADAGSVQLFGINLQTVQRIGRRPFVFDGVIGPVDVASGVTQQIARAALVLAERFRLRGLCGLDFLLDAGRIEVLELNARPPASLALYADVVDGGAMASHLRACGFVADPPARPLADAARPAVRGIRHVYTRRAMCLTALQAAAIAEWPGAHDLPAAGARLPAGAPLCTLSASGVDPAEVQRLLDASRVRLLSRLKITETTT